MSSALSTSATLPTPHTDPERIHDLAEHLRVVLLSTTEGDDKPGKYPKIFRTSHTLVISKTDLLPHVPFSVDDAVSDARQVQPEIEALTVCALSGEGVEPWCSHLDDIRNRMISGEHVPTPLR